LELFGGINEREENATRRRVFFPPLSRRKLFESERAEFHERAREEKKSTKGERKQPEKDNRERAK